MSGYTGQIPDTAVRTSDWLAFAPCKADPDLMFATHAIEEAKAVCRRCPAIERCLQWALETGEEFGVWGGLSEDERRTKRRTAARPVSIDDYAGTRPERRPVTSWQEAWELYARPDGEHILWTGPKVINVNSQQATANRISFYLDRERWPEGDTKRTCATRGCVKPTHLDDRVEREQAAPTVDVLRGLLDAHTARVIGGHLAWTGLRRVSLQGREFTPRQLSFIVDRGRPAVGVVRTGCAHKECVLAAHLSDQEERGACGTRIGYRWHRSRGEEACGPCKAANAGADNRLRRTGTTLELAS